MTQPIPDEYRLATTVNGLPTATFPSRPFHRTITNIVVGNTVTSTVTVYRGQLGSVPVAQNQIGASNTLKGGIPVPAGQQVFVVWSAAGNPVSGAFARVSFTRTPNPLEDSAPISEAEWSTNAINSLTLPSSAGPGTTRIVIGSDLPPPLDTYLYQGSFLAKAAIIFYSGTLSNDDYQFLAVYEAPSNHYVIFGAVLNGAVMEAEAGIPAGIREVMGGSGARINSVAGVFQTIGGANSYFMGIGNPITGATDPVAIFDYIQPWDPNSGQTLIETWHDLALFGSWTNFGGGYKNLSATLNAGPKRTVSLQGVLNAGTSTANGTKIAALPTNYIPLTKHRLPVYVNTHSVSESPAIDIATNGDITILGCSGASFLAVDGVQFYLD